MIVRHQVLLPNLQIKVAANTLIYHTQCDRLSLKRAAVTVILSFFDTFVLVPGVDWPGCVDTAGGRGGPCTVGISLHDSGQTQHRLLQRDLQQ